ncbi:alpha/beta hydrolase [Thiomicrospira sp. ALE5]|uniref:alpha/beta hydrolase n=1 Tax=Thiomicrospira sp. ALE5 TaxID=748650 RepID=UPI0008F1BEA2|nr:alpha/beta fold hydrolase [Thiomicrospira sp. ALE5]SFR54206.1 hypothetical protein SAMN03092900_0979 [Thiomicrospira sp. ALE5]
MGQAKSIVFVPGPVGMLECRLGMLKPGTRPRGLVVLLHPHPLYEGSMNNKVVTTLEKSFLAAGWQTVAFNFRGVGRSEGFFDEGRGEQADLAAVVTWAQGMYGELPLALAGFSFGSYIALCQAEALQARYLITVAPPVNLYAFESLSVPAELHWSLIQGGQDEVVPPYKVANWMRGLKVRPDVYWREAASHYFHGELIWLQRIVAACLT